MKKNGPKTQKLVCLLSNIPRGEGRDRKTENKVVTHTREVLC